MQVTDLPFNQFLGLSSAEESDSVTLLPEENHLNHLKTLHATVLFGLAEAASGQVLLNRFPELTQGYLAVLRSSNVKFRQPGKAGCSCAAVGNITRDAVDKFASQLDQRGRAILEVTAVVEQDGVSLLTGSFSWFVTRNDSPSNA